MQWRHPTPPSILDGNTDGDGLTVVRTGPAQRDQIVLIPGDGDGDAVGRCPLAASSHVHIGRFQAEDTRSAASRGLAIYRHILDGCQVIGIYRAIANRATRLVDEGLLKEQHPPEIV